MDAIEVIAEFDGAIIDVAYLVDGELPHLRARAYFDAAGDAVLEIGPYSLLPAGRHVLEPGARLRIAAGAVALHVARVPAPERTPMPTSFDWTREIYVGGVTLAVSTFLLLVYSLPPEAATLSLDVTRTDHFAHFVLAPPELPPPPPTGGDDARASTGHAARAQAGTLGTATAKRPVGTLKLPGPVSRDKVVAAAQARVQSSGIIGVMREMGTSQIAAMFRPDSALGDGADHLIAGLHGSEIEDGYGSGFDEIGHGPGGGGDGDKTIGAGPLGTVGFCRGAGCSDRAKAYARSAPTGKLAYRAKAPEVVPGQATVKCGENASCLDKEIIRRVVRQHRNEIAYCYERALGERTNLAGRVTAQWTIDANGRVLASAVTDSTLPSADVSACIAQAVRRWEFPRSQQMSTVRYSWTLATPAGSSR